MADKKLSFTAEKIDELLNKVDSNESFTSGEKEKLASLENYTHPPKHEATVITEDETHRFVTDAEKNKWNNKAEGTHIHEGYAEKTHNHTKANITDFAHTHNKSEIKDFTHKHTKSDISDYTEYVLPKATSEVLGGVKIGDGINVSEGTISLGEHEHTKANISDFAHTHNKADISDFTHKHTKSDITDLGVIPTKVSQLTNDSNFATETFVTTKISEAQLTGGSDVDLSGYATKEELKTKVDKAEGKSLLEDTEIERLKTLKNYNDTEIKGMINNKADKTSLHSHTNMEELNKIAVGDKAKWDAKSDFDGDYNSLENKPDNDLTNELKANYDKAYTHSQTAHAPATAQKNSDITKAEIEAKLIGNITTHEHNKYSLATHNHNDAYEPKIVTKKTAFNKDFGTLEGTVAEGNHAHEGYANTNHNHDSVYSKTTHNHSDLYEPVISEKKTAFNKDFGTAEDTVAKGNHTHASYSETTHNHDKVYAKQSETYTKLETDGKIAEEIAKAQISGGSEVDLSGYATKVELQAKADKVHTHDEYASSEHNHNEVYEPKIASKKTAFNKDFGTEDGQVAEGNHTHEGFASADHTHEDIYASISHNHNSLYANKSSEHTHTNKVTLDKISDEKINEWNSKADGSHTHEGFATIDHNHDEVYEPVISEKKSAFNKDFGTTEGTIAKGNHTHEDLSPKTHTHTKANITDFPTKLSQFQNDMNLTSGTDGREVELQKTDTHIQWKYSGEGEWKDLIALSDLSVGGSPITVGHGLKLNEDGSIEYYEGEALRRTGLNSHAEGFMTQAIGNYSHAEGFGAKAEGDYSHAENKSCKAIGLHSHAEGNQTSAGNENSHAEGMTTSASGICSHAEGMSCISSGAFSHAEGQNTESKGDCSHSEGAQNIANGDFSHVGGYYSMANGYCQTAIGTYNIEEGTKTEITSANNLFIIGNGSYDSETQTVNRSNAFRVTHGGAVYGKGAYNTEGADYAEFFEWEDGNIDNEDRAGYFVTFAENGETIRKANSNDEYILGIVSVNPAIMGDNQDENWQGKYVRDKFGRLQYEMKEFTDEHTEETYRIETPIISKEFNSKEIYQPRRNRKEWDTVGMLGKLLIRDDGTCIAGGFCKINDNGIATKSEDKTGYYVMRRMDEDVVKILFK